MAESPRERWVQTSRLGMYYRDWGPGSPAGIPVVALHGLASSSRWYDLVAPLLADTHRIVVPDQRGHGRSEHPSTGYDWQSLAADVVELMEAVGLDRPAVLGHSWGGYVALALAAKFPRSLSRLVLIDGGFMDWTRWPGAHRDWFENLLKPRRVTGGPEEYLASQQAHLANCWSTELEPIVMSMVHTGEDGQVRDILDPANHAQVLDALWTEPPSTMFHRGRMSGLGGARGTRRAVRRVPVRPYEGGDGRGGLYGHPRLPRGVGPGYHPRHRLPQARRAFPDTAPFPGRRGRAGQVLGAGGVRLGARSGATLARRQDRPPSCLLP